MKDGPPCEARTCYGIDLSADRVFIVKSTRLRKAVRHETVLDQPLDGGAALAELAARLPSETEKGAATLAGCVPVHESFTRWLRTPLSSPAKALKVLPSLLDIQLPFPLESCTYRVLDLRRAAPGGAIDALAVAARTDALHARLEQFRKAGLEPMRLDHEGLALWAGSVRELPLEREAPRVVAWMGHDHTALALGRGEVFLGAHSIRTGVRDLFPDDAPGGADERLQHLASRVQQILRAQFPDAGASPLQWAWAGPGAARPAWIERLQAALAGAGVGRFLAHADAPAFLARALATRALLGGPLACNFREGPLAHAVERRRADRARARAAAAVLAAGLALCVTNLGWRALLAQRRNALQSEITRLASSLAGTARVPRGQEVLVVRRALEEQAARTSPFLQAFRPSASALLYNIVRTADQQGIDLKSLSLRPAAVTLNGTADDWNRCEILAGLLRDGGLVVEKPERQDAGADERVHFALKAAGRAAP